ncbi:hypothetical protein [Candidatus Fukatsuia endosymbiont of Tuberolachnus salignus]|uniref:hypothetical protein n=1 Tax=Candidatus Fukatsuia endosymbiont of Tuberolachnus salignus TaxID=3077957 RepID=UPI00313C57E3
MKTSISMSELPLLRDNESTAMNKLNGCFSGSNKFLLSINNGNNEFHSLNFSTKELHGSVDEALNSLRKKGMIRENAHDLVKYKLKKYKESHRLAVVECYSSSPCLRIFSSIRGHFGNEKKLEETIDLDNCAGTSHPMIDDSGSKGFSNINIEDNYFSTADTDKLLKKKIYPDIDIWGLPHDSTHRFYSSILESYTKNMLLEEVNRYGRPVKRLKFVAWLAEKIFRIHGVGQTNSASCAKSVADTINTTILHRAIPEIKGNDVILFVTEETNIKCYDSIAQLSARLAKNKKNMNGILVIPRKIGCWRSLFCPTPEHRCNVVVTNNEVHLIDVQKKKYYKVDISSDHKSLKRTLKKFIGSVGAGKLELYDVGFRDQK